MKISRTNNPLTIASAFGGTNQHWQVNWNQGVTEPGSSGSPLFDPNHRIVGQLEGGLSKCGDASLIDFYGRFDLSWTGGGTNATRLSNWLDPNNSGALTTNTTNVANLFSTNPTINGDDAICSGSKNYTLFGAPAGTSVSWSISNSSTATLTGGGNQITLTKNGNGFLTLTAVIATTCGTITVTKLVNVGIPQTNYKLFTAQTLTTLCGWDVTLSNLCNATGFVWQDFTSLPYWQGAGSSQYLVKENVDYGPITLNYTIAAVYQCGTGNFVTKSVNVPAPWRTGNCRTPARIAPPTISSIANIQVAPNPTTNTITLIKKDNIGFTEIRIFDKLGTLRKQIKYPKNTKSATMYISGLPSDIYQLQVFDGVYWSNISFSKL
jgi:lysyl endopeptidase